MARRLANGGSTESFLGRNARKRLKGLTFKRNAAMKLNLNDHRSSSFASNILT